MSQSPAQKKRMLSKEGDDKVDWKKLQAKRKEEKRKRKDAKVLKQLEKQRRKEEETKEQLRQESERKEKGDVTRMSLVTSNHYIKHIIKTKSFP
ncbi:putative methyltransferase C9orf114 homolog [Scleropages formosus]|uniref:putative methyltransferase C9orf114 homolog n=1 Tax=Scleropages formosus TaxID=113540 RepID=UPI0010FAC27C|nr:putative methyltransferase C9orf114 homolog [Scleropages formosus]